MKKWFILAVIWSFSGLSAQEIDDQETKNTQEEAIGAAENAAEDAADVAADLDNANDDVAADLDNTNDDVADLEVAQDEGAVHKGSKDKDKEE